MCGLPRKYCIHRKGDYTTEVMKLITAKDIQAAHVLKKKTYIEALKTIPHKKLLRIPRPPKDWQVHVLYDFQTKQSLHEVEIPPPNFYRAILDELQSS